MAKELGKHDFLGWWMRYTNLHVMGNVSVGCFEWVPALGGRMKKGKDKVRVSGPIHLRQQIAEKARVICEQLDAGTYTGPKNVKVKE